MVFNQIDNRTTKPTDPNSTRTGVEAAFLKLYDTQGQTQTGIGRITPAGTSEKCLEINHPACKLNSFFKVSRQRHTNNIDSHKRVPEQPITYDIFENLNFFSKTPQPPYFSLRSPPKTYRCDSAQRTPTLIVGLAYFL